MMFRFGKMGSKTKTKTGSPVPPTPTYKQDFTKWTNEGGATLTAHTITGTKQPTDNQEVVSVPASVYNNVPWKLNNKETTQINMMTRKGGSMINQYLINPGENDIDLSTDIAGGADSILIYISTSSSPTPYSLEETPTL